jgi:hypothetical protein
MAFHGSHCQSPMSQKPITKGAEGRRRFSRGVSDRPDGAVLPQKVGEALNPCCICSRNVFLVAASRTIAAVCPESLDGLLINTREIQAFGFQPPTKVNG